MINFATIGTGNIASSFVGGTQLLKNDMCLKAVYSRSYESGIEFGKAFGCSDVVTDLSVLARRDDIDAVYIASPNSLHFEQALLMLQNKKHVLLEKPSVQTAEQLKILIDTARQNNVIFLEAIIPMYLPAYDVLRNAVKEIGDIHTARFQYCQYSSRYTDYLNGEKPNVFSSEFAGGALMDLGVYCIYPAIDLFGEPKEIKVGSTLLASGVDASSAAIFEYGDKTVSIIASKTSQSDVPSEILGDKGSLQIDYISRYENISLIKNGQRKALCGSMGKCELMKYEAKFLCDMIKNTAANTQRYKYLQGIMLSVCKTLEQMRRCAGMNF